MKRFPMQPRPQDALGTRLFLVDRFCVSERKNVSGIEKKAGHPNT